MVKFAKYDSYRNSEQEWLSFIPEGWRCLRLKYVFRLVSEKIVSAQSELPYIGMENIESWTGKILGDSADVEGLASKFEPNDILFGKLRPYLAKVTLAEFSGICSTEFLVCRTVDEYSKYFKYLLGSKSFINLINSSTYGSKMPRASTDFIREQYIPIPSFKEQNLIANFLDQKTAQIDAAIAIKEQQIELLKERKQIIIQQAVTQGLDPNVRMNDSGVEWIGQIPQHWEIRRSKFVFTQRKERAWKNDVQLSATQAYGVIPQDQYEQLTGKSVVKIMLHLDKRKHVEKDDFVISMRSFQGGLERAWSQGCIRSSYIVLRSLEKIEPAFYGYLLKLPAYIAALQQTASFIRDGQDLNFENFSKVDLFIPPIEEQKEIASYVESFMSSSDKGIALLEAQIQKLKEYKTTLINSAVTGKIKITPETLQA